MSNRTFVCAVCGDTYNAEDLGSETMFDSVIDVDELTQEELLDAVVGDTVCAFCSGEYDDDLLDDETTDDDLMREAVTEAHMTFTHGIDVDMADEGKRSAVRQNY